MKLKVGGLYGVGEAEKKWWWWVLGKWVADPEPDNPESGFGVPRISVFVNGFSSLFYNLVLSKKERKRERERERSMFSGCENARSFSWGGGFFGFWV